MYYKFDVHGSKTYPHCLILLLTQRFCKNYLLGQFVINKQRLLKTRIHNLLGHSKKRSLKIRKCLETIVVVKKTILINKIML